MEPSLIQTFFSSLWIDFCNNRHCTGDISSFGLCTRHTSQARGNKQHSAQITTHRRINLTSGIEHCNSCTMDNSLWADIHIRTSCHLSVLRNTQGIVFFPVFNFGVIRNHHSVGYNNARSIRMRRKQPQRMSGIHDQGLFLCHFRQILHCKQVLCPVREYRTIASISNELMWMLSHSRVQVILYH